MHDAMRPIVLFVRVVEPPKVINYCCLDFVLKFEAIQQLDFLVLVATINLKIPMQYDPVGVPLVSMYEKHSTRSILLFHLLIE